MLLKKQTNVSELNTSTQNFVVNRRERSYHRVDPTVGYTGHFSCPIQTEHILSSPNKKSVIRGYTGHLPTRSSVIGEPIIPSEEKQLQSRLQLNEWNSLHHSSIEEEKKDHIEGGAATNNVNFRSFAKHMDTMERYGHSVEQLMERGQTQEMLLRIVQAKMSERVNSYAIQLIRTRKLFEAFDLNGDGVLDEMEFRICLEKLNIQFDDVQCLALFAYFDHNNDGFVEWEDFADHAMVHNPKGGTAVLPKMITAVEKNKFIKEQQSGVKGLMKSTYSN